MSAVHVAKHNGVRADAGRRIEGVQEVNCFEVCIHNFCLVAIYTIVGVAAEHGSGLTLDRPALQELTEADFAGKVDVVLISSLDRIGRDWGMTKQYIDLLTEHKVKLLCLRERVSIDSSSFSPFFT